MKRSPCLPSEYRIFSQNPQKIEGFIVKDYKSFCRRFNSAPSHHFTKHPVRQAFYLTGTQRKGRRKICSKTIRTRMCGQ